MKEYSLNRIGYVKDDLLNLREGLRSVTLFTYAFEYQHHKRKKFLGNAVTNAKVIFSLLTIQ